MTKVKFKPGKTMYVSDMLSQMNLPDTEDSVPDIHQLQLNAHLPMSPQKYEELKQVTANDEELQCIGHYIEKGWPDKKYQVQWNSREYWPF